MKNCGIETSKNDIQNCSGHSEQMPVLRHITSQVFLRETNKNRPPSQVVPWVKEHVAHAAAINIWFVGSQQDIGLSQEPGTTK